MVDIIGTVDEVGGLAERLGDMLELGRVGTIRRSDDEDDICLFCEYLHRALAVGRGIADISCLREYDVWDPFLYRGYDAGSIIDGESGLGEDDVLDSIVNCEFSIVNPLYICYTLNQCKVFFSFIHHAEGFLVSPLANIEDMVSLCDRVTGFAVHLLDQWTGGIDPPHTETPQLRKITRSSAVC